MKKKKNKIRNEIENKLKTYKKINDKNYKLKE
jgi:hypothetical protein